MALENFAGLAQSALRRKAKASRVTAGHDKSSRFEQIVMPRLDSAYNLARWLTRSDADAQDVVQEACLRAFKYIDSFDGQHANAWLLTIVRNACYTWLKRNRPLEVVALGDNLDAIDSNATVIEANASGLGRSPEAQLIENRALQQLDALIEKLPAHYREVLVLRELEELSYREIAEIVGVPIGTVMSRLARGREMLQAEWRECERRARA